MPKSSQQQLAGGRRRPLTPPRRLAAAFALTFAWIILLVASHFRSNKVVQEPKVISVNADILNLGSNIVTQGLAPPLNYPLFSCPDGRKGLHVCIKIENSCI